MSGDLTEPATLPWEEPTHAPATFFLTLVLFITLMVVCAHVEARGQLGVVLLP